MKKTILSIAFVTTSIFAFNALAQEPCCKQGQECCQTQGKACCEAKGKPERASKANFMEGITLTEQQQAQVKALNEKYAQARKDKKKDQAEAKEQRLKEGKEAKQQYLKDMQQILTPEQYVTYLENMATKQAPGKMQKKPKGVKNGKDIKRNGRKGAKDRKGAEGRPTPQKKAENAE